MSSQIQARIGMVEPPTLRADSIHGGLDFDVPATPRTRQILSDYRNDVKKLEEDRDEWVAHYRNSHQEASSKGADDAVAIHQQVLASTAAVDSYIKSHPDKSHAESMRQQREAVKSYEAAERKQAAEMAAIGVKYPPETSHPALSPGYDRTPVMNTGDDKELQKLLREEWGSKESLVGSVTSTLRRDRQAEDDIHKAKCECETATLHRAHKASDELEQVTMQTVGVTPQMKVKLAQNGNDYDVMKQLSNDPSPEVSRFAQERMDSRGFGSRSGPMYTGNALGPNYVSVEPNASRESGITERPDGWWHSVSLPTWQKN